MENMEEKKEMNREEVTQVNGGSFVDDIACRFGEHKWEFYSGTSTWEQGENVQYSHLICSNCKADKYQKHYFSTGKTIKISKSEYEAHA